MNKLWMKGMMVGASMVSIQMNMLVATIDVALTIKGAVNNVNL